MVHNYSSVGQNDRPNAFGASADCSGRMTLICNSLFSSPCCCCSQAGFVGTKKDSDSFSCSVSMEVPTSHWDDSQEVYVTYSSTHFSQLPGRCCPCSKANRTSGVIEVLLNQTFFDSATTGDSTEQS